MRPEGPRFRVADTGREAVPPPDPDHMVTDRDVEETYGLKLQVRHITGHLQAMSIGREHQGNHFVLEELAQRRGN